MAIKIMLVDDDHSTNYYHQILLEEEGLDKYLLICNSVDSALEQLQTLDEAPLIICIDINMPMRNGWDFLKDYKKLPDSLKAKYVIMLSTITFPDKQARLEEYPMIYEFWVKPLDIPKIKSLL
jgi:CheY-like chemotaxis protein